MRLSVVLPVYNEEQIIKSVSDDIRRNSEALKIYGEVEFLFIDDGSTDNTRRILESQDIPNKRIISTQHLGLSSALYTGIREAVGDIIITMDADLQFSLEDVPRFVDALIKEDADIVTGYRVKRNDNIVRIISSKIANTIKRWILKDDIRDSTCTLKAFKSSIRDKILYNFDGFHRFIPSFALMNNLKLVELPVTHRNRAGGQAKFGILNRLPDVLVDVIGVRWLKYKRFSPDADVRRFSFYPDILFLILFLYVFFGLFSNYFRVVDDFWLYGSLNRFIGYDYSKSYGWEKFIFNEIVPPLIRIIYAVLMNLGRLFSVRYPLEWANKLIGIIVLFLSYPLITRFFNQYFQKHCSKWIAFVIVFYGVSSSEIYSGLARSFSYILVPLLALYLKERSVPKLTMLTFFTALVYPILLPLFFLSILLRFLIDGPKSILKAIVPIAGGLVGLLPMLYNIDLTKFSPPEVGDRFLSKSAAFNLPISSDLYLLFGISKGSNIIDWLNFNLLHQWTLNNHLRNIIALFLIIVSTTGILRRLFTKYSNRVDLLTVSTLVVFYILALTEKEYVDKSYIFKWGFFLLSSYFVIGVLNTQMIKLHKVLFLVAISSVLSFIVTHLLSYKFGFGVHEPGRQLQRAYAIILPFLGASVIYTAFKENTSKAKNTIILLFCMIGILFFPNMKLVSPVDRYVIERVSSMPFGSLILSHPLTANWIVTHTDKYSTIIDEQIRVTNGNPIRGSKEKIMPTEMAYIVLSVYYAENIDLVKDWCRNNGDSAYILVEEYYYSNEFLALRREPYYSFVERNNKNRDFVLTKLPLQLRHHISPEAYLVSCKEIVER